jgi:hypothetical protein
MTSTQPSGPSQPDAGDYAYNLFRNKQCPEIICAVPEDRPVPHFIDAEQWTFEQPLRPLEARPPSFDNNWWNVESVEQVNHVDGEDLSSTGIRGRKI